MRKSLHIKEKQKKCKKVNQIEEFLHFVELDSVNAARVVAVYQLLSNSRQRKWTEVFFFLPLVKCSKYLGLVTVLLLKVLWSPTLPRRVILTQLMP